MLETDQKNPAAKLIEAILAAAPNKKVLSYQRRTALKSKISLLTDQLRIARGCSYSLNYLALLTR